MISEPVEYALSDSVNLRVKAQTKLLGTSLLSKMFVTDCVEEAFCTETVKVLTSLFISEPPKARKTMVT